MSVIVLLLAAAPAEARRHMPESWARQHYATAERLREALNGRPEKDRSRREYQRVIEAYRRVYYGSPASTKADPSVVALAELLVEMGRQFDDSKVLKSAIGQYEFLRREYPGSRYRFDALFTIGEIYKQDLDDLAKARETFEEFVHRYPHNRLASQAREELAVALELGSDKPRQVCDKPREVCDKPRQGCDKPRQGWSKPRLFYGSEKVGNGRKGGF